MDNKKEENGFYEFPEDPKTKVLVKKRKGINRELVKRLLQSKRFSYVDIADYVGCTDRHVRRIRDELIESGELTLEESKNGGGIVAAEFDEEVMRACGESFKVYMQNKRKHWKTPYNFVRRTWEHVWNKPSIFLMKDNNDPTGAEMCQLFIQAFGNNKKRIRDYKKYIRPFFVFIGRGDLNTKYLTMSKTQDPDAVRELPQLEDYNFPLKLDKAISAFKEVHGTVWAAKIKFKITSGIRTGKYEEERGWTGLRTHEDFKSYIHFYDKDRFTCSVFEKQSEQWRITWIPKSIRHILYEEWKNTAYGDPLIVRSPDNIRQEWYRITEPILGFKLEFHDFRKVFATWLVILGVQFNDVAKLNVGWSDLDTLDKHYNQLSSAIRKSDLEIYKENIPDWFKEELEEYAEIKRK
ncbi:MAG: hypothetical protein ACW99F_13185 [Candidatus Hodarchaeales archaeon]|jgi:integrase